jgi:hypothetical protein
MFGMYIHVKYPVITNPLHPPFILVCPAGVEPLHPGHPELRRRIDRVYILPSPDRREYTLNFPLPWREGIKGRGKKNTL